MAEEKTYVFGEGAGNGILGLLGPMHISSALKIKPYGEEYQYLTGEIGQSMFKIAKRFLCDDCRQKLVIEIKEIDKKD